jgi:hypothetical protein
MRMLTHARRGWHVAQYCIRIGSHHLRAADDFRHAFLDLNDILWKTLHLPLGLLRQFRSPGGYNPYMKHVLSC